MPIIMRSEDGIFIEIDLVFAYEHSVKVCSNKRQNVASVAVQ